MAAAMICRFLVSLHCLHRFDLPDRAEDCANWCRNSVSEGTDGDGRDRHEHVFLSDMSFLQWVPGSVYVCLNSKRFSQRNQSH